MANIHIFVNGKDLEHVPKFKYLGGLLCEDGRCSKEICVRIGLAKIAFAERRELFTKNIGLSLEKRLVKTLVWSVLLYACEAWTLKKADINKIKAFEMWCCSRIL